jgi:acetyl esterase/lipase
MPSPSAWRPRLVVALACLAAVLVGCDTGGSSPSGTDDRPYTSSPVTLTSDTLALPATLVTPDTNAAVPGVVFVHGSGPLNRNGQSGQGSLPPIYGRWAQELARQGIASLRYDKRTTLTQVREADPRAVTFLDFVRDAVAAGERLRSEAGVDPDRIVYVGHSQGGNAAPAAATRLGNTAGVATLAAPALAVDSLLVAQLSGQEQPASADCTAERARAQFDSLRSGRGVSDGVICGAGTTFWRQWIRHSQKADSVAAALDPPLFVQQGRADQLFPGETLKRTLSAWGRVADAGDATVRTYPGVDHYFLNDGSLTTAEAPLSDLADWIRNRAP